MDVSLSTMTTLARNWWAFVVRGIVAIAFGLIAWFWPDLALNTLIWIFAIFAFATGVLAVVAAVRAIAARERWMSLAVEGVIGIGAGIVAIVWPDLTAKTFLYLIAVWAIVSGLLAIVSALRLRREIHGEWMLGLAGIAAIVFGVIAIARPETGALAVLWLIGLSAIVYGVLWTVLGFRLHSWLAQMPISSGISSSTAPGTVSGSRSSGTGSSQPAAGQTAGVRAAAAGTGGVETNRVSSAPAQSPSESAVAATGIAGAAEVSTRERGIPTTDSMPTTSAAMGAAAASQKEPAEAGKQETGFPASAGIALNSAAGAVASSPTSTHARDAAEDAFDRGTAPISLEAAGVATGSASGDQDVDSQAIGIEHDDSSQVDMASRVDADILPRTDSESSSDLGDLAFAEDAESLGGGIQGAASAPPMTRRERALAELFARLPPEGSGWVHGNGTLANPQGYPLKGNASSHIFHAPGGQSYDVTIADICFATEADARSAGFRPRHGDPVISEVAAAGASTVAANDDIADAGSTGDAGGSSSTAPQPAEGAGIVARERSGSTPELDALIAGLPPEGSGWVRGTGVYSTPAGYPVKGNASSKIYHLPGGQNYQATIAEICFASVDDARAGGFRPRHGDPAEADWSQVEETPAVVGMGVAHAGVTKAEAVEPSREELQLAEIIATLPPEGSVWVKGTGVYTTPGGFPIKGNASSRIYHVPGGQNYQATIPEICFATVDAAKAGGFRARHGDPAEPDWSLVEVTPGTEAIGISASGGPDLADLEPNVAAIFAVLPAEGTGWRLGDGSVACPASHPIKGNASSKIFHQVGGRNYEATIPEFCFATPEDALDAGFRQSKA